MVFLAAAASCALATLLPPSVAQARHGSPTSGVVAWGGNEFDQLGVEKPGPETCETSSALGYPKHVSCSRVPGAVPDLTEVVAVDAYGTYGESVGVALLRNGTVEEWGGSFAGISPLPTRVAGLNDVAAISRGELDGVALLRNGTVEEWEPGSAPKAVVGLQHVTSIAPYGERYAVLRNGEVTSWNNGAPEPVIGLANVQSIAVGPTSLAVLNSGRVMGWGSNWCLGGLEQEEVQAPTLVPGLSQVASVAVGGRGPLTRCFALLRDGTLLELSGGSEPLQPQSGPHEVAAVSVAAGGSLTLALLRNGSVKVIAAGYGAWQEGAFGDGLSEPFPPVVANLTHATAIAAAGTQLYIGDVAENTFGLAAWSLHAPAPFIDPP